MKKNKVMIIVIGGVRPQFIKIAALQEAIKKFNVNSNTTIVSKYINTGQHYDNLLSNTLIRELNIKFDYNLDYKRKEPMEILGSMIPKIYKILEFYKERVDWVVIFGDATTTIGGAIAASRCGIPIIHFEAGVRTNDLKAPEEIHRRVVSHISSVHFCTSKSGVKNLAKENITNYVYWTGDIAYDFFMDLSKLQPIGIFDLPKNKYILFTLHKSVNINSDKILCNLITFLTKYKREVLFVAHPKTKKRIIDLGLNKINGIVIKDSLPYKKMISAIKGCAFIITDSGGLQREACYLGKRCLVRRDELGWSFLVNSGLNKLIGIDKQSLRKGAEWMESKLPQQYDNKKAINQFFRQNAWKYALNKIVKLNNLN